MTLWRSMLLCFCTACASWQVETASPQRLITEERPRSVLVTLKDSSRVLMADPVVRRDSIAGVIRLHSAGELGPPFRDPRVAVALDDVAFVSVAKVDTGRTLMLFIPIGILLGVLAFVAS